MPEYDVFISYASQDRERVLEIATFLERAGVKLWQDTSAIKAGEPFIAKIDEGLVKSRRMLFCMSQASIDSDWAKLERHAFLSLDPGQRDRSFIPLLLSDCIIPGAIIKSFHHLDFRNPAPGRWTELLHRCGKAQPFQGRGPLETTTNQLPNTDSYLIGRDKVLETLDRAWESPFTTVVSLVAAGGVGKTALVNGWLNRMQGKHFGGAARVYAWSFYSQGSDEGRQASADPFLNDALRWFGEKKPEQFEGRRKGERLAKLVRKAPTLLLLDGLEPLQFPPDKAGQTGLLKEPGIAALLKELAGHNPGLCVITTRVGVRDLIAKEDNGGPALRIDLETLLPDDGAKLLHHLGIHATEQERCVVSQEFGGHALALNLLGRYLATVHEGDLRQRDTIPALTDETDLGGHAKRVMASYDRWLGESPEHGILLLLGLFDRPAYSGELAALTAAPPIPDLTDRLPPFRSRDWKVAVKHLRAGLHLIAPEDRADVDGLDAHPLVREHFGAMLQEKHPEAWREGHRRLYEYFKALPAKERPDTPAELEPLFRAVGHGCGAGLHQQALDEVHGPRIRRGNEGYSIKKLGLFGLELGALAAFFDPPWGAISKSLSEADQALLLHDAAFVLRGQGRLREAVVPMAAGLELCVRQENWKQAAIAASNLSELHLTLGAVGEAVAAGRQCVEYADRSGDAFWQMGSRTTWADALHQAGDRGEAARLFEDAEARQQAKPPQFPRLYSLQGFRYCDLLLDQGSGEEVVERAKLLFSWRMESDSLLSLALEDLARGRAHLLNGDHDQARQWLDLAVAGLGNSGNMDDVPRGLLARAALWRETRAWAKARKDLDEAWEIAERGEMRLHLTDLHLEEARLALAMARDRKAHPHLEAAARLIQETGYKRRLPELKQLQTACGIPPLPDA